MGLFELSAFVLSIIMVIVMPKVVPTTDISDQPSKEQLL